MKAIVVAPPGESALLEQTLRGARRIPLGSDVPRPCPLCDDGQLTIPEHALLILNGIRHRGLVNLRITQGQETAQTRDCPGCSGTGRLPRRSGAVVTLRGGGGVGQPTPASEYRRRRKAGSDA